MQDIDQQYIERKTAAQEKCRSVEAQAHAMMQKAIETFAAETHDIEEAWTRDVTQRLELMERARSGVLSRDNGAKSAGPSIDITQLEAAIREPITLVESDRPE
jgi:hypothetical protein